MDDFGLLARDFGIRPQGKSAPMSASKPSSSIGSGFTSDRSASNSRDPFDDVFGGPPKYPTANPNPSTPSFDPIFNGFSDPNPNPKSCSMPVYDKPLYDDDIFDGVPGIKSSAKVEYEDVFASMSQSGRARESGPYDDLLGGFARSSSAREEPKRSEDLSGFDDLIPGFGGRSPRARRVPPENNQQKTFVPSSKTSATMQEDPFVVFETSTAPAYPSSAVLNDPLEHLDKPTNSGSANFDTSPASAGMFDDIDAFDGLAKSAPASEKNGSQDDKSPLKSGPNRSQGRSSAEPFDVVMPTTRTSKSFEYRTAQSPKSNDNPFETNATVDPSPRSFEHLETADDIWLTVSEIPLFTQPTSAPPPSRPPPPLVIRPVPYGRTDPRRKDSESSIYPKGSARKPAASSLDEFEDFTNKSQSNEHAEVFSSEDDIESNLAAAAAMKEAMDRAEAKFKQAKEVREKERDAKSARIREFAQQEKDEDATPDPKDWEDKQEKIEREQRDREEREREQRRLEKERDEREKEKARQAVERATREARERAAAEARARAERAAERAAVDKVNAEARQRAERAAVQRVAAEARERAAAEARQKARDKAAAEARDKAAAEAKAAADKAATEARDRAAVDRAAAEARARAGRVAVEKANAEARERAAAAAKERLNKTENDLESFFGMGARANSAPKQRAPTTENIFDTQAQACSVDGARRTSSAASSTFRKASSTTSLGDDLSSVFGVPQSSGEFQEIEGESEERRKARLERHQRTLERAAKALAEKNARDMQTQMEQAERHRLAETLDVDIRRWAAGKEGNLRALLSTLQYVLWPECQWQPVSLTDLITGDKVKKAYRKATLCIHPDKVQQKGATLQQKYIAEKVFDLLKEAWNKLNSEELF